MDDKIRAIQDRLRRTYGASMAPGERFEGRPIVAFDEVAGLPNGGETFVANVTRELASRGWRVASVDRVNVSALAAPDDSASSPVTADGCCMAVRAYEDHLVTVAPIDPDAVLDAAVAAVPADVDIIIGQNFGFAAVPRILMTRRVQEGFNLGLPHIIAYVSDSSLDVVIPRFTPLDVEATADFVEQTLGLERAPESEE